MRILQNLNGHRDLQNLTPAQRQTLCDELRSFLIESVAKTGGHLASNLGVVELSVALETVYDTNTDRLVFDVGHQSYVHKLLTGRQADFARLRQFGGIAGFPKPSESETDAFVAGHASSSVSIALGMARARTLQKADYRVAVVIGDGAATGGMTYEALNDAAVSGEPMVIILNDNAMSIAPNVGGLARHLSVLRTKESYLGLKKRYRDAMSSGKVSRGFYNFTSRIKNRIKRLLLPGTIFENMGLSYLGPVDGHDLEGLITLLRLAREMDHPVLIHVRTKKGKGYAPAEQNPAKFHGIGKFDPVTGQILGTKGESFSASFGKIMLSLGEKDPRVCGITAAMPEGTGLAPFMKRFPNRTFDVGIAEEHAVSMAGGLAKQGMIPVVALYSTFLQRSYDQVLQDIAMLRLHVVLAIDRAGLVGEDGETHHGVFDIGFLRQAPGMRILCPGSLAEQQDMLRWAVEEQDGPVAIRYPRGGNRGYEASDWNSERPLACHRTGKELALVSYGVFTANVLQAAELLSQIGIEASVIRLTQVEPLPVAALAEALGDIKTLVLVEEACTGSGIQEALAWQLHQIDPGLRIYGMDLGKNYVTHGNLDALYQHYGLDSNSIAKYAQEVLRR